MNGPYETDLVFDHYGMPTGSAGLSIYVELLERIHQEVRGRRPGSGILLYEVLTPQATRAMLLRSGTDLEDHLSSGQDPSLPAFGLALVAQPDIAQDSSALWGHRASGSAGALAAIRYGNGTNAQLAVRDIVLLTRSGIRAAWDPAGALDYGQARTRTALPDQGLLTEFTAVLSLLAASLGVNVPESRRALAMTVPNLVAVEVVTYAAMELRRAQAQGTVSGQEQRVIVVASAIARVVRLASILASVAPAHDAPYVRELQHIMRDGETPVFDATGVLSRALRDCRQVLDRDWVSVLSHPPSAAFFAGALPAEMIQDPAWGGSHLIGMILANGEFPTMGDRGLRSLPEPERTLVVDLLDACGCSLPKT